MKQQENNDKKDQSNTENKFQFNTKSTFTFQFNFGKQTEQQKQKEEPTQSEQKPISMEDQMKNLPSAKESIYYKCEQIKYFVWVEQKDGKGKYEKQDQLINLQIYKQETQNGTNNCIKIYYKNQKSEISDMYVQDLFFTTLSKENPSLKYIKGRGLQISGLNFLHKKLDKNGKETNEYQISSYYIKLTDEQMDQMEKIIKQLNENEDIKPIEIITTGKYAEKETTGKKEEK